MNLRSLLCSVLLSGLCAGAIGCGAPKPTPPPPPPECATNADCAAGACEAGECREQSCVNSAGCAEGVCRNNSCAKVACETASTCAAGEGCVDGSCSTSDPCALRTCTIGLVCRAGACRAQSCTTSAECAAAEVCSTKGACVQGTTDPCEDPDACPKGEVCRPATGCEAVGCMVSPDCAADERCEGSLCRQILACDAGRADCDFDPANGCEILLAQNSLHCGACFQTCEAPGGAFVCVESACQLIACDGAFADCDGVASTGCEVDTDASIDHCGACNAPCAPANAVGTCTSGSCGIASCAPGFGDCDGFAANGCEAELGTSGSHCGACGSACAPANAAGMCTNGACAIVSCNPGFENCDGLTATGCEANTLSDPSNCGACGQACATGQACTAAFTASFATQPLDWNFNGSAFYDSVNATGVLTTASGGQAGTIILKKPIALGSFTVTFDFNISQWKTFFPGDGMGFFIQTNGPTAVGAGGGNLGMGGLNGYGFELDTHQSGGCLPADTNANHVAVSQLDCSGFTGHLFENATLPIQLRGGWHTAQVEFTQGTVTMKLDGTTVISSFVIPGFVNGTPYFLGFAASTGADWERHEIKNVTLTLPWGTCH